MQKKCLVSNYSFQKYVRQNLHSPGPRRKFNNLVIGYIKKGYAKFLYKGKTIYAYEGDLIYIACEIKYQSVWFGDPDVEWYAIKFNFKSQYDFYEYQFQILKDYPSELFDKICETYEESYFLSVSYFYRLLDDVYKKLEVDLMPVSYMTIEPAVEYIENNYNQTISISTLIELCHCSESGFFKLFKKLTGVTPITYKHNIMIQHALELLSHTNLSVEEISFRVGFSSSNYFRKIFTQLTGKTPKEVR